MDGYAKLDAMNTRFQDSLFLHEVAQYIAPHLQKQIQISYENSKTPELQPFQPLKKPTGLKPVIGLKDSYQYNVFGSSIQVTSLKEYAVYHHTGTRYIPARSPWPKNGFPAKWNVELGEHLRRALSSFLLEGHIPTPRPLDPALYIKSTGRK